MTIIGNIQHREHDPSKRLFSKEVIKSLGVYAWKDWKQAPEGSQARDQAAYQAIVADLVLLYLMGESRRILYKISDEVVTLAVNMRVKEKVPVSSGSLLVPTFMQFNYEKIPISFVFIPASNCFELWKSRLLDRSRIPFFQQAMKERNFQGVGIYAIEDMLLSFISDMEVMEEVKNPKIVEERDRNLLRLVNAISFLLKAQGAPIEVTEKRSCLEKMTKKTSAKIQIEHTVHLAAKKLVYPPTEEPGTLDKDGKVLADTAIVGHLRNQPCGPGSQERRLTWITEHVGRRWCLPNKTVHVKE